MASALPTPSCASSSTSACTCTALETALADLTFDTIAIWKSTPSTTYVDGLRFTILGYTSAYDGQGGTYIWEAASVTADDGINILIPNDITHPAAGRAQRFI